MKIFVLNLERATGRRALMLARLQDAGLQAEILPAVEGLQVDRASLPAGTEPGLSAGEIGCYLSHLRFWETVVERGLDHAILLEDDVIVRPELLRVAGEIAELDLPFDAVRLSALEPVRGIPVAMLSGGTRLVLPNKNPSGAQGYLVSLAGAKRLLARLAVPRQPVDDAFDAYWKYGLCIPVVFPCLVEEDRSMDSTIGSGRFGGGQRKSLRRHLARVAEAQRRKITVFLMARRLRVRHRSIKGQR
jgi:glycosyl transferase family 25